MPLVRICLPYSIPPYQGVMSFEAQGSTIVLTYCNCMTNMSESRLFKQARLAAASEPRPLAWMRHRGSPSPQSQAHAPFPRLPFNQYHHRDPISPVPFDPSPRGSLGASQQEQREQHIAIERMGLAAFVCRYITLG